ncbi:hypothetical protein H9P43_009322 [Blastocladiella emersonii ATCC 22665]|nr:hypothetical protein H9P43_009322 [Blastocladiella emersonii ATCC 22665]
MKSRFSALDIAAVVQDLQRTVGMRLQNVYDINAKTYLFKFARTEEKELVLIESGIRMHSTEFEREKPPLPSPFAMKLRKHLRQRRLTAVRQLARDRVAIFEFGGHPLASSNFNLVCEFYASGNVVLTDGDWTILAVLRVVKLNDTDQYRVGSKLASVAAGGNLPAPWTRERVVDLIAAHPKDQAKRCLAAASEYPTPLIEHGLLAAGLKGNQRLTEADADAVLSALAVAESVVQSVANPTPDAPRLAGYIITDGGSADGSVAAMYEDVHPVLLAQYADRVGTPMVAEFATFNAAADAYFSALESQRAIQRARAQEAAAHRKLAAIEAEQDARVESLAEAQRAAVRRAQIVEHHAELVDAAIAVINSALATGMDWVELDELVRDEKARANPVASAIEKLELNVSRIHMRLVDPWAADDDEDEADAHADESDDEDGEGLFGSDDDDEEDGAGSSRRKKKNRNGGDKPAQPQQPARDASVLVPIDLDVSAMKNAARLYTTKKQSALKQQKTLAVAEQALKSAASKIKQDLEAAAKQTANASGLSKLRKPMWFEKFHWFISSENYLVVGGRDMHQNEILVKRYLRPGDVYVHADLHGAPSIIIKNMRAGPDGSFPEIPPSTLAQAGNMALCLSRAWDSKIVTSAWWVWWNQVSKSAPSGEYLTTGSFMIRGKKNVLPPSQLVYGLGIVFRLDEESVDGHRGERASRHVQAGAAAPAAVEDEDEEQGEVEQQEEDAAPAAAAADDDEVAESTPAPAPAAPAAPSLIAQLQQLMLDEADDDDESDSDSDDEPAVAAAAAPAPAAPAAPAAASTNGHADDDNEDADEDSRSSTPSSRGPGARISRAERRKLKRGGSSAAVVPADQDGDDAAPAPAPPAAKRAAFDSDDEDGGKPAAKGGKGKGGKKAAAGGKGKPAPTPAQPATPPPSQVRGKKAKLKKAKAKYADQSDEERELAMALLKPNQGPQPKGKKEKKKAAAKAQAEEVARLREEQRNAELEAARQRREEKAAQAAAAAAAAAEQGDDEPDTPAAPVAEEDEEEDDAAAAASTETTADQITELLDSLTGAPRVGDGLQYAVCMCAPYSSLASFKYKVKLTPGTMKKGKASKLCVQIFQKAAQTLPAGTSGPAAIAAAKAAAEHEANLIRGIPEPEWTTTMRAQVKVFAPQLADVQKGAKGGKKKGGKGGRD